MNILEDYYSPSVLFHEHSYSASGIYHQIQPTYDLNVSIPQGPAACQAGLLGCHEHLGSKLLFMDYSTPQRQHGEGGGPSPCPLELGLCGER